MIRALILLALLAGCARDPAPPVNCFSLLEGGDCDFEPLGGTVR